MSNKIICRGYVRVSTTIQAEDGISLETQQKRIEAHCKYKDWTLEKIYIDAGVSAKDMERPQLKQLLTDIKKDEYFIACDLSRFSRNTKDALNMLENLEARGVNFVCLNPDLDLSTPMGRFMFRVLMSFHELERDNIAANVKLNMKRLVTEGKLRTKPPFGWKFIGKDKDLQIVKSQQDCIERVKQMYSSGLKVAQITKQLNSDGTAKCLLDNKKTIKEGFVPQFYDHTIRRILIDHGFVGDHDKKFIKLNQRITSCHKSNEDE